MTFNMATSGQGWRLAASLIQLGHEIAAAHPDLTCLGTLGDAAHVKEGTASDHNPFVKDPHTGIGIVRAIDIGGPDAELIALQDRFFGLYRVMFGPLWQYGYALGTTRNLINNWGLPLRTYTQTGDGGHLHVSVTQLNGHAPNTAGYVAAIDYTGTWGISSLDVPAGGGAPTPTGGYPPVTFSYPFSGADHFGDIKGDRYSHGGDTRYDGPDIISRIRQIQARLNQIGVGHLAVDGVFGPQTVAAATAFQHKYLPHSTTLWGQLWRSDCIELFGPLPA